MTQAKRWYVRVGVGVGVLLIGLGVLVGVLGSITYTKDYTVDGIITDYGTKYGFPGWADAVYVQPAGKFIYFHTPTGLAPGDKLQVEYDGLRRNVGFRFNGQFRNVSPRPSSALLGAAVGVLGGLSVALMSLLLGRRLKAPAEQRTLEWRRRRLHMSGACFLAAAAANGIGALAGSGGAAVACILAAVAGTSMLLSAGRLTQGDDQRREHLVRRPLHVPPLDPNGASDAGQRFRSRPYQLIGPSFMAIGLIGVVEGVNGAPLLGVLGVVLIVDGALWTWRVGVIASPTHLIVRTRLKESRIPWEDVAGIELSNTRPFHVWITTTDGERIKTMGLGPSGIGYERSAAKSQEIVRHLIAIRDEHLRTR